MNKIYNLHCIRFSAFTEYSGCNPDEKLVGHFSFIHGLHLLSVPPSKAYTQVSHLLPQAEQLKTSCLPTSRHIYNSLNVHLSLNSEP